MVTINYFQIELDYSKILEFLAHHDSNEKDSTKIKMNDS